MWSIFIRQSILIARSSLESTSLPSRLSSAWMLESGDGHADDAGDARPPPESAPDEELGGSSTATETGRPTARCTSADDDAAAADSDKATGGAVACRAAENCGAAAVAARLTDADVAAVGEAVPEATGDRYEGMHGTFNTRL